MILLLVCANGFFVAAEFAIVKIRASQLKPMLKTGDWRVPMALRAVNNLDACLSATQLGITLPALASAGWESRSLLSGFFRCSNGSASRAKERNTRCPSAWPSR